MIKRQMFSHAGLPLLLPQARPADRPEPASGPENPVRTAAGLNPHDTELNPHGAVPRG